jgi:hypothetical protein
MMVIETEVEEEEGEVVVAVSLGREASLVIALPSAGRFTVAMICCCLHSVDTDRLPSLFSLLGLHPCYTSQIAKSLLPFPFSRFRPSPFFPILDDDALLFHSSTTTTLWTGSRRAMEEMRSFNIEDGLCRIPSSSSFLL